MKAILFDDLTIEISERTPHIGSLWHKVDGVWRAYDEPALRWIHERAKLYDAPVLLDVGAHTGLFTCLAAHHPKMTVWAVEPLQRITSYLFDNARLNNIFYRVYVSTVALGAVDGAGDLHVPDNPTQVGMATLGKPRRFKPLKSVRVGLCKLDTFVETMGIERLDIIKIDTEGAELDILRGGERTIREYRPNILIEYEAKNTVQFGYEPIEIRRLLESWGATCKELPPRDLVVTWEG